MKRTLHLAAHAALTLCFVAGIGAYLVWWASEENK